MTVSNQNTRSPCYLHPFYYASRLFPPLPRWSRSCRRIQLFVSNLWSLVALVTCQSFGWSLSVGKQTWRQCTIIYSKYYIALRTWLKDRSNSASERSTLSILRCPPLTGITTNESWAWTMSPIRNICGSHGWNLMMFQRDFRLSMFENWTYFIVPFLTL